jgi:phytol kinase
MMELFWNFLSLFGDYNFWILFSLVFIFFYVKSKPGARKQMEWIFKLLLPSIIFSATIAFLLKLVFQIPRLCEGLPDCPMGFSLPSMHAAVMFAFFGSVLLYTKKPVYVIPSLVLALLVSLSRMAVGVHTPVDMIWGSMIGLATAITWYIIFDTILRNRLSYSNANHFYFRKMIHFSGLLFFILYFFIPRFYLIVFLSAITTIYLIAELLRTMGIYFPVVQELTIYCSKKKETNEFVIAPLLFFLAFLLLLFLPQRAFVIASLSLIIGDTFAGLIGYSFGKSSLPHENGKTFEGSIACFASTFASLLIFFDPLTALVFSLLATLLESLFVKYENFLLPVSMAILAMLL